MDLDVCELDIDTTVLYAPTKDGVFIRQPLGISDGTNEVRHLGRCISDLKQSPREFDELLRSWLGLNGWVQCKFDPCIHVFR
jgi:hypothetical protein